MKEVTEKRDNYANLRTHLANERTNIVIIYTHLSCINWVWHFINKI